MDKILEQTITWLENITPKVLTALIILLIGWWLSAFLCNLIRRAMHRAKVDAEIISFTNSILKTSLRIVIIISSIAQLGVNITSIVAAVGAAGVTLGLALKDSLSNLASGIIILLNKTFHIGDYLEVENVQGTVTKLEMMFTTLTTADNKTIVIPNSVLTSNNIINYTTQKTRRLDLEYFVGYDEDITKVKSILNYIVDSNNQILKTPKPIIGVSKHRESCLTIEVKIWCDVCDYWDLYYLMQESVKTAFDENNIKIPFNQIDVHIKNN